MLRPAYSAEVITSVVGTLADRINRDYSGRELLLVVVLKGAFCFGADLARQLKVPLTIDFVRLSSYQGTSSSGTVDFLVKMQSDAKGKDVLIVEDIIDTGATLAFLLDELREYAPNSLKVCTFLDKKARRIKHVIPDYVGLECSDEFLVGYGLDLDERYRELPAIYEVIL